MSKNVVDEVVAMYPEVPGWWADVFRRAGMSPLDVEVYLETASRDQRSPLYKVGESGLMEELLETVADGGIVGSESLLEDYGVKLSSSWFKCTTSVLCTPEEQALVSAEVSSICTVKFEPKVDGIYTGHAVARALTGVSRKYLYKLAGKRVKVLEVGATLMSIVYSAPDPSWYKAAIPVLSLKDSARLRVEGHLRSVVRNSNGVFSKSQVSTARLLLDEPGRLYERKRVQDFTTRSDVVISNMSSFDIDMDEIPSIMAKHGARMWLGTLVRVKGLNRVMVSARGEVPVLAMRYAVDVKKDEIRFHFRYGADLEYVHKFSSFVKYEERNDFRWSGAMWDYVYIKLPVTTDNILYYAVLKVPHVESDFRVPSMVSTGMEMYLKIKAFRMRKEVNGNCYVEPYEFDVERLAFDKALEMRRAQGRKGSIVTTFGMLKSMRLRFYLSGVPLGIEHRLHPDTLDGLAMVVELQASDGRRRSERVYADLMRMASSDMVASLMSQLQCWAVRVFGVSSVREALASKFTSVGATGVETYPEVVRMDQPVGSVVDDGYGCYGSGCSCSELRLVAGALSSREGVYLSSELEQLREYEQALRLGLSSRECECIREDEEVAEEWFDVHDEGVEVVDSGCSDSGIDCDSVRLPDANEYAQAVEEFADISDQVVKCVRSESVEEAKVLAMQSWPPSKALLERSVTNRMEHYAVTVVAGRVGMVTGKNPPESFMELYSLTDGKFYKVKDGRVEGVDTEVMYANTSMEVMVGEELARRARDALYEFGAVWTANPFPFVWAVPGAGKTWKIEKKMKADLKAGLTSVVLTATSLNAEDIRSSVFGSDQRGDLYVRTCDSMLMWGLKGSTGTKIDVVYVDEAPMLHAGQVVAALMKLTPVSVELYGDFEQIPFCSFLGSYVSRFSSLSRFSYLKRKNSLSHRLAVDACAAQLDAYDGELYSCACHDHTLGSEETIRAVKIGGVHELVYDPDVRYLVFTKDERYSLRAQFGTTADVKVVRFKKKGGMATVHEEQGSTRPRVALVRLKKGFDAKPNPRAPSLYNKRPYVLSSMTRHTAEFVYYTASEEFDLVQKCVMASRCPVRRSVVRKECKWEEVKDRAYQLPDIGGKVKFGYEKDEVIRAGH